MDLVRAANNGAVLGLPEHSVEPHSRDHLAVNQIACTQTQTISGSQRKERRTQHVARPDAFELIGVAHHQQVRVLGHRANQRVHQVDVNH